MIENRKDIVKLGTTILFEGIYEGKECYGLEKEGTGKMAVFDHNPKLFEELVEYNPTIQFIHDNMYLYKNKFFITVARYMYCLCNGIDTTNANSLRVHHLERDYDSDVENCMSDNLYLGSVVARYDVENNYLTVSSCRHDFSDVTEPLPFLIDIIQSGKIKMWWRKDDGRFSCRTKHGTNFKFPDLVYLAYYGFEGIEITMDNYEELIYRFIQYKRANRLEVEHLDSNYHNHLAYNIALVDKDRNREKNNLMERIKEPYCIKIAYDNGIYKIVMGVLNSETDKIECGLIGKTEYFETVVDLLRMYQEDLPENVFKRKKDSTNIGLFTMLNFGRALADSSDSGFVNLDAEEWSQYIRRKEA